MKKMKRSGLSKYKIKTLKMFSSLVTFILYAMILRFFKSLPWNNLFIYLFIYLFIQYLKRCTLLAEIAILLSGPL